MELKEFKEQTGGYYKFYRNADIQKRGYAICYDEICTIDLEEKELYIDYTLNSKNEVDKKFNTEQDLLNYVIEGKSVEQMIKDLKELVRYHVSMVSVDNKGNIKGQYEPHNCGNVKEYLEKASFN